MTPHAILQHAEAVVCRPWLRHLLQPEDWTAFARAAAGDGHVLLALWADTQQAHALFFDPGALSVTPVSVAATPDGYPALSPLYPAAALQERMVHDLWGHVAQDGTDQRPWLDHQAWPHIRPLSFRPLPTPDIEPAAIEEVSSDDVMRLPLGPLWGERQEVAQLVLTLNGARVQHAEARLGYAHKGILGLMRGRSPRAASRFAARLSGDATVAHSIAFALATEAASDTEAPPRAATLRVVMAELERIAGHLDNLAATAALIGAARIRGQCGTLRELLLRACEAAFGHRLMMDRVVPGGLAAELSAGGAEALLRALGDVTLRLPEIRNAHDTASMQAHLACIGRCDAAQAVAFGVGGVVGRACGRGFDVRMLFAPGYADLMPRLAMRPDGDAASRQQLRLFEIEESVRLVGEALRALPGGAISVPLPPVSGEGIGCAESARGDVWHWVRLDHGQVATAFPRDPGWGLWPLAETVMTNACVDDAALVRLSFALPASGMDL